jgi:hypothetical protein
VLSFCSLFFYRWDSKSVQRGFRATRALDEFKFYFADATLFLMDKYALARLVPRFQRSQFKVKPVKLLRSRSHCVVVKWEFKLPPYAKRRFIS